MLKNLSYRLVNFSGGKVRSTNTAGMTFIEHLSNKGWQAPDLPTIGGPDSQERILKTIVDRDDDPPIGNTIGGEGYVELTGYATS